MDEKGRKIDKTFKLIALGLGCVAIVLMVLFFSRNWAPGMRFGIFGSIDGLNVLDEYAEGDAPDDGKLMELAPHEQWAKNVTVDGANCTVRGYVFDTHEDAAAFYKRVSNRTDVYEGLNFSAHSGSLGMAKYVTMLGNRVLYVTGGNMKAIQKVVDKYLELDPDAVTMFDD